MVTFRWLGELRKFAVAPIVVATVDDNTADGCSVSADPFRSRLNDYIRAMFERAEEISGSSECIVDN
jgi:hypothetical protein